MNGGRRPLQSRSPETLIEAGSGLRPPSEVGRARWLSAGTVWGSVSNGSLNRQAASKPASDLVQRIFPVFPKACHRFSGYPELGVYRRSRSAMGKRSSRQSVSSRSAQAPADDRIICLPTKFIVEASGIAELLAARVRSGPPNRRLVITSGDRRPSADGSSRTTVNGPGGKGPVIDLLRRRSSAPASGYVVSCRGLSRRWSGFDRLRCWERCRQVDACRPVRSGLTSRRGPTWNRSRNGAAVQHVPVQKIRATAAAR